MNLKLADRHVALGAGYTLVAIALVLAIVFPLLRCTPVEAQHRAEEGTQLVGHRGCIEDAKKLDGGEAARWRSYTTCADAVDAKAGKDGGP